MHDEVRGVLAHASAISREIGLRRDFYRQALLKIGGKRNGSPQECEVSFLADMLAHIYLNQLAGTELHIYTRPRNTRWEFGCPSRSPDFLKLKLVRKTKKEMDFILTEPFALTRHKPSWGYTATFIAGKELEGRLSPVLERKGIDFKIRNPSLPQIKAGWLRMTRHGATPSYKCVWGGEMKKAYQPVCYSIPMEDEITFNSLEGIPEDDSQPLVAYAPVIAFSVPSIQRHIK
jgi:hypothetical protein